MPGSDQGSTACAFLKVALGQRATLSLGYSIAFDSGIQPQKMQFENFPLAE
jgi:hypothetical protein